MGLNNVFKKIFLYFIFPFCLWSFLKTFLLSSFPVCVVNLFPPGNKFKGERAGKVAISLTSTEKGQIVQINTFLSNMDGEQSMYLLGKQTYDEGL